MSWNPNPSDDAIPRPWTKGVDQNGQPYYINTETGQIRRQPPVTAGLKTYQKANAFIDPEQWDLVIETMACTIHPDQQLRIFQKLKKIAEKMITKDDPKYRTLYLNNPKLQHTVLAFDGGLEFLYNLGFEPHAISRDKLVCHQVNTRVVQACLICLEDKIEAISYDVHNDDKDSLAYGHNNNPSHHIDSSQHNDPYNWSEAAQYNNHHEAPPPQDNGHNNSSNIKNIINQFEKIQHIPKQHHAQISGGDKEQVMANLGGLGFNNLLKQSKSADHAYHSHHRANRPKPPPPVKHVADQQISSNITRNFDKMNKLNSVLGLNAHNKQYKTFIFIRHGNSIWNRFKNSGVKRKWVAIGLGLTEYWRTKNNPENHADTWVVDAPLSKVGIDEAYGLSRFLGRHLTLRQFESLADLEHHQSLATPIKDALRIIETDILDKYAKDLTKISPDLLAKCVAIKNIMETAHAKIQRIMLETEAKRNQSNAKQQIGHKVTKGADYINGADDAMDSFNPTDEVWDEKCPDLLRPFSHVVIANKVENVEEQDDLEMPLDMEWVLDQMVDSSSNSIVVTSNLRRAISTAVIGLWDRFGANKECVHILPCLQELGMNVDTHTPILDAEVPQVSNFEKTSKKLNVNKLTSFYSSRLVVEQQGLMGKKSLTENEKDTKERLNFFCDWAFKKNKNTIIACGHSHWFRAFFKTYLPKDTSSMAGKRKLQNCGVAGFRMICQTADDGQRTFQIIERSITPIYRGFV
eukprot:294954_1